MKDTRNIILLAGLRLFLQNGYKEVTLQDILEASGQAKGTFYYYFKNKWALFEECARYIIVNFRTVNFGKLPNSSVKDFIDGLLAAEYRAYKRMASLGENFKIQILVGQASVRIPEIALLVKEQEKKQLSAWEKILESGRDSGEIRISIDNAELASLFITIQEGISAKQLKSVANINTIEQLTVSWHNLYEIIRK